MSKFTPGPWASSTINGETWVQAKDTTYICKLYEASNLKEANARLIAKAPKMYELLNILWGHAPFSLNEGFQKAIEETREIIKEIDGE